MSENVAMLLWLNPGFWRLSKNHKNFFWFFGQVQSRSDGVCSICHTLDNDHVKGNFILFAWSIKVMVNLWGKTSYYYFDWTPTFSVLAKKLYFLFVFWSYSKSFWWCLCCFAINMTIFRWKVISYSLQWRLKVCEFFVGKRRNIALIGPRFLTFEQKSQKLFLVFRPSSKLFWWCL